MKIEIPTTCPNCETKLELINTQLFCRNKNCSAQSSKKLEAFAKGLKIRGLGPATISKLNLNQIIDIYSLTENYLKDMLGNKVGIKLSNEINKARIVKFETFLSSLSIPLIGKVAASKVAAKCSSIKEMIGNIDNLSIGEKAKENILQWYSEEKDNIENLPVTFIKQNKATPLLGKVCITGKLYNFKNRDLAAEYLESLGFNITNTVNKNTTFLVDEENKMSSKRKKAEQLNIKIVTIKQLEEII